MSSWVPKFAASPRGQRLKSVPPSVGQERAPGVSEGPIQSSFSYEVDSNASNYAMSEVGSVASPCDKSEAPSNVKSNDADAQSLSSVEDVDLFTDQEDPEVAAKVEQQWNQYSQQNLDGKAPRKVEPKVALRKKRFLVILGVIFLAVVAVVVGVVMATQSSSTTNGATSTDLTYVPVTPSDQPVSAPDASPPLAAPDEPPSTAAPTMALYTPTSSPTERGPIEPGNEEQFRNLLLPLSGEEALNDTTSPQSQAFEWVLSDVTQREDQEIETRYVAATLYYSLGGDAWLDTHNFLSQNDVCEWNDSLNEDGGQLQGIFCTNGEITELRLQRNQLNGVIPQEISYMTSVTVVNLEENTISGPTPAGVGSLPNLAELILQGNGLTGTIPDFSGNQGTLTVVNLVRNQLSGSVTGLFTTTPQTSLAQVLLSENMLMGTLPETIGQYTGLIELRMEMNMISGSIPTQVGLLVALKEFSLSVNQLNGTIPTPMGQMTAMDKLQLDNNYLTGQIPKDLSDLKKLKALHLENNMLSGNVNQFCNTEEGEKGIDSFSVNSCKEETIDCSCCTRCCNPAPSYECTGL